MKTYCKPKQVNIESAEFNGHAVHAAFSNGKMARSDFQAFLASFGTITREQIETERAAKQCGKIVEAIDGVTEHATKKIVARSLDLKPVRQFKRIDGISMKERDLCQEDPERQVFEYVAVYALQPLFRAKLLPYQFGSIPKRGQVKGKRRIERIIRRKLCGRLDAIKGDVKKAYPSTKTACVIRLLQRDIHKNKPLLWLCGAIMEGYPNGVLLIGGYFSSWAFNYVMAYVLRYIAAQEKVRRGTRQPLVIEAVCYADDFTLFGRISQLMKAMKKATRWASETLGLNIKKIWLVIKFPSFEEEKALKQKRKDGAKARTSGLDMMGFVVRRTYTIIRKKIFKRIRRQLLRAWENIEATGFVPWWRARKLTSYNGWIKNSDSIEMQAEYKVPQIMAAARYSVSQHCKKQKTGGKAA